MFLARAVSQKEDERGVLGLDGFLVPVRVEAVEVNKVSVEGG